MHGSEARACQGEYVWELKDNLESESSPPTLSWVSKIDHNTCTASTLIC